MAPLAGVAVGGDSGRPRWDAEPSTGEAQWDALLAAFTEHCLEESGRPAPSWTSKHALTKAWTLDTPRMSEAQIQADTPDWLTKYNIFIAKKDLVTI